VSVRRTLPSGEWVELVPRLNHAQMRRIRSAKGTADLAAEGLCAMVTAWCARDADGRDIPCPSPSVDGIPVSAVDPMPEDVFAEFAQMAVDLLQEQPDPKGSAGTLTTSPQAQP
jgi:hypothetical protein